MSYFAVTREAGPGWRDGKGIFEQPGVDGHARFMTALSDEGFLLAGGPLGGTERERLRVLLIVDANGKDEIHRRLAADPWVRSEQLVTVTIEPWNLIVGTERLSSAVTA